MKPKVLYTQLTQLYWPTSCMNNTSGFLLVIVGCHTSKIHVWVIFSSLVCIYRMFVYPQHHWTWVLCSYTQWNMSVYKRGFSDALFFIREGLFEMRSAIQGFHYERRHHSPSPPISMMFLNVLWLFLWETHICWDGWYAHHLWPWIWTSSLVHFPVTKSQTEKCLPALLHTYIHIYIYIYTHTDTHTHTHTHTGI